MATTNRLYRRLAITALFGVVAVLAVNFYIFWDFKHNSRDRLAAMAKLTEKAEREFPGKVVYTGVRSEGGQAIYMLDLVNAKGERHRVEYVLETGERFSPHAE